MFPNGLNPSVANPSLTLRGSKSTPHASYRILFIHLNRQGALRSHRHDAPLHATSCPLRYSLPHGVFEALELVKNVSELF